MSTAVQSSGFRVPGGGPGQVGPESADAGRVFAVPPPTRNREPGTRNRELRAPRARAGFTMLEVLVAVAVAAALFGICVGIYVRVNRYKSRSEQLLYAHQTVRSAFQRIGRDLAGLHVADSDNDGDTDLADYWEPAPGKVTFLAATENPGKLDYCTVSYYAQGGRLYRELSATKGGLAPDAGWPRPPPEADCVIAEGVLELTVSTVPASPAAGRLPASVTVTLRMADPGGNPGHRLFTATFRPGSEEN